MDFLDVFPIIAPISVLSGGATRNLLKTHKTKNPRNSWLDNHLQILVEASHTESYVQLPLSDIVDGQ